MPDHCWSVSARELLLMAPPNPIQARGRNAIFVRNKELWALANVSILVVALWAFATASILVVIYY